MSCSRPFAERFRGLTLIELMVSQTIAIVVISAMMAIVVAMVNKLQSEVAISDAQVNLRQVSHLLMRDTQGIGSDTGATAGDFVLISDGGTTGPDVLTIFRRDESICGGSIPVLLDDPNNGVNLQLDKVGPGGTCPFAPANSASCSEADLLGRALLVIGLTGRVAMMSGHNASSNGGKCQINYPPGKGNKDVVDQYNATYNANIANINKLFSTPSSDPDAFAPIQILSGNGFTFRLDTARNMLQRSTNFGNSFTDILEGVHDLQVQRVYQKGDNTFFMNEPDPLPAGVTKEDFVGLRLGLITFGRAVDGLNVPPPTTMANRKHAAAPSNRRYRASFVITAARNRNGA